MNELNTFWKIIDQVGIQIPPIQRDYAQGRNTEEATRVRKSFLDSILKSLETETALSMDFVYGKIFGLKNQEEYQRNVNSIQALLKSVKDYALTVDLKIGDIAIQEKSTDKTDIIYLIPLDGQQRLTTLFLLHWYLAKKLGDDTALTTLSRFKYSTRKSSSAFLKLLTDQQSKITFSKENESIKLHEGELFKTIQNLEYFSLVWLNDPTVQAMMNMLQSIHYMLQEKTDNELQNYWSLLTQRDLLYFSFLNLQDFNLADDLYVKMNARGKELTSFENFKAWLFGTIEKETIISPETWEDYKHKFDVSWNDIFWKNKDENIFNIDEAYFNYFKKRYLVDLTINAKLKQTNFANESDYLTATEIRNFKENFDFERNFSKLFKSRLPGYFETLNSISSNSILDSQLDAEIKEFKKFWFAEPREFTWINLIKNYVFISFFEYNADRLEDDSFDFFLDYYRVLNNLINNQTFDSAQLYQNVLRDITTINRYMKITKLSIHSWLERINDNHKTVFTKDQIQEEKLKWQLVKDDKSNSWIQVLIKAERHSLFNGKIDFLLRLSDNKFDSFKDYFNKISPIFELVFLAHKDKLLQRSLLTIKNYFQQRDANTYYFFKNDISTYRSRRENWLGFLTDETNDELIRKLIFNEQYNWEKPIESLNSIIDAFIKNNPVEILEDKALDNLSFYELYIYCPQLFDYGESNIIKLSNSKYAYQLNKSNTGGYFTDILLDFVKINHFYNQDTINVRHVMGWDNSPTLAFNGQKIYVDTNKNVFVVEIEDNPENKEYFLTISDIVRYIKSSIG